MPEQKEQLIYIRLLYAVTCFLTFGLLVLIACVSDSVGVLWVGRSVPLVLVAMHNALLTVALFSLLAFMGILVARQDDFFIAELAHKCLYQLHVTLIGVGGLWFLFQRDDGGGAGPGFWLAVYALLAMFLWRASYGVVHAARQARL